MVASESYLCSDRSRPDLPLRAIRHGTILATGGNQASPGALERGYLCSSASTP